jgi:hypothetical protein
MDINVPVTSGNPSIPISFIPSNIYSTGGQDGPIYVIPITSGGATYVPGLLSVSFVSRSNILDINIKPLDSNQFPGGEGAILYPTTITYITDN